MSSISSGISNRLSTSAIHQAGPAPAPTQPKGTVKLAKGDLAPLPKQEKGFAKVQDGLIKEKLRFKKQAPALPPKASKEQVKKHGTEIKNHTKEKLEHTHGIALATGREGEPPSVKKFFEGVKHKLKDCAVGKFFQRNVLHHLKTTQVSKMELDKASVNESKKTTITFTLKAERTADVVGVDDPLHLKSDAVDHKIEVSFDRLRNQRAWYNPKRWFGIDQAGRSGKLEDKLGKLEQDITRQVRLRNLGIGLEQERRFSGEAAPGLLASLPETTGKNGIKAPALETYSGKELESLKTGLHALARGEKTLAGLDRTETLALVDKAIHQKQAGADGTLAKSEKLTTQELKDLRNLNLLMEIEKLDAIDMVAGDYCFTEKQTSDLGRLRAALLENLQASTPEGEKQTEKALHNVILSTSRSMREMSIMCWAGLETEGDSYDANITRLLVGKEDGLLPESLLMAPFIYSPQALRIQAAVIRSLAEKDAGKYEKLITGVENLESELKKLSDSMGAQASDSSSNADSEHLHEQAETRKKSLEDIADHYESLAETTAGMYRFQGMLPILAKNNEEEITSFLQQQLGVALAESTGLQDDGNNYGKYVAGGALMAVGALDAAVKGNQVKGAAIAGVGAAVFAGGGPSENTTKYRDRLQMLSNAIMNGMVAGSEEQLIKSNRLLAEEKCEKTVQTWAKNQHGELTIQSKRVGDLEEITESTNKRKALVSNADGKRAQHLEMIRTNIVSKLDAMGALKKDIENTTKAIINGPVGEEVKVHDKLKLKENEFEAQEAVKQSLGKAGKQVEQECDGLITSFEILQAAYNPIDGRGAIHNSILEVEKNIAGEFSGDSMLKENGFEKIGTDVDNISSLISNQGRYLTNDHATHLHDLVGAVGESVSQAAALKSTMQDVARGLASPSLGYMTGQLDKDVFKRRAQFVEKGEFERDLLDLKKAREAVSERGRNPYALFRDPETRQAVSGALDPLISDADKSKKAWDKCLVTSTAMVVEAQEARDIYELRSNLSASSATLREQAKELNEIAEKYRALVGREDAFNFDSNIDSLHERSLREGTARLVGLPTPPDENCHKGLDALAGPLANTKVHAAVARYLVDKEDKAAAFADLFGNLPEATDPKGWSDDQGVAWRKGIGKEVALNFIGKLHALEEGANPLSDALELAQKLCDGDDLKALKNDLYAPSITASLEKAANNEHLKTIFGKSIDQKTLMNTLMGQFDTLVSYGLDSGLRDMAPSVGEIYAKFKDSSQRADLSVHDLETLLRFATALGDLKENPEATRQHKVKLATLDLLANVNPDFSVLKDPKEADTGKLKAVFTPKPKDIGAWERFKDKHNLTERNLKELQDLVQATEQELKGAKDLFTKFGGSEPLLNPQNEEIRSNRDNLLKAYTAYQSGNWAVRLDPKNLIKKGAVLTTKELGKEIKSSNIDFQLLKYTKTDTYEKDTKLEQFAQRIKNEQDAANLALNIRSGQNGIYQDFKPVSRDVADWIIKHGKGPLDENGADVLRRVFSRTEDKFLLDRLAHLKTCLGAEESLKDHSPKLTQATKQHRVISAERDRLLGEHQALLFKNAVRAAILSHCSATGTDPTTLKRNPHEQEVKKLLATWGWKEGDFPAGSDISTYFEEAKNDGYLDLWKREAGSMRSDLSRIETAIDQALTTLQTSLLRLNSEIAHAMSDQRSGMSKESDVMSSEAESLLRAARAHSDNLLNTDAIPAIEGIAETPLNQLVETLKASHPSQKEKIDEWKNDILKKIRDEKNPSWKNTSILVRDELDELHDTLLASTPGQRPAYHENITASRALEFDRSAYRFISELHNQTGAKAEAAMEEIERARRDFKDLTVANSLPSEILRDEKGNIHHWVKEYATSINADPNLVANGLAQMTPIAFLNEFKTGNSIHKFFASRNDQIRLDNLTSHMQKWSSAFECMERAVNGNFSKETYPDLSKTVTEAINQASTLPTGISKVSFGKSTFSSIGNVLEDPKKGGIAPILNAWTRCQIDPKKVSFKSEVAYLNTVAQLVDDQRAQEAEEQENDSMQGGDEEDDIHNHNSESELIQSEVNDPMMAVASRYGVSPIGTLKSEIDPANTVPPNNRQFPAQSPQIPIRAQGVQQFGTDPANGGPQSFANLTFKQFGSDTERGKKQNGVWNKLSVEEKINLGFVRDYVHVPIEAGGYCLLTSLASAYNMPTSELQNKIEDKINESGRENLKKIWEEAKSKSRGSSSYDIGSSGLDPHELIDVFDALGINFNIVSKQDNSYGIQGIKGDAVEGNPTLFHSVSGGTGHFDLLIPTNIANAHKLPYDGSRYIAK